MSWLSLDSHPFAIDYSKDELLTGSVDWIGSSISLSSTDSGALSVGSYVELITCVLSGSSELMTQIRLHYYLTIALRIKLKEIAFVTGAVFVDLYNLSFRVQALVNTQHGNGAAGSIPGSLLQGEGMLVERIFANAGRLWVSGKNPRGERVDLDPKDLIYVEQ